MCTYRHTPYWQLKLRNAKNINRLIHLKLTIINPLSISRSNIFMKHNKKF